MVREVVIPSVTLRANDKDKGVDGVVYAPDDEESWDVSDDPVYCWKEITGSPPLCRTSFVWSSYVYTARLKKDA